MSASLYPLFLSLRGCTSAVTGGSEMAEVKTRERLDAGAQINLIAPQVTTRIFALHTAARRPSEFRG